MAPCVVFRVVIVSEYCDYHNANDGDFGMIPDETRPGPDTYTPSPAEVEANTRYQRERSIEIALRACGGVSIAPHHLVENAKIIDAYITGTTNT